MQVFLISNPCAISPDCLDHIKEAIGTEDLTYWTLRELSTGTSKDTHQNCQKLQGLLGRVDAQHSQVRFVNQHSRYNKVLKTAALYVAGGNSLNYLRRIKAPFDGKRTVQSEILSRRNSLKHTYIGSSAGAMIMGSSVKAFGTMLGGIEKATDPLLTAMGLVRAQIIPHYDTLEYPACAVNTLLERFSERKDIAPADCRFILMGESGCLHIDTARITAQVFGSVSIRDIAQGTDEPLTDDKLMDEVVWRI